MKRRPKLSLDQDVTGASKQVPGFESEELATAGGPTISDDQRPSNWSSAAPQARRVDPVKHVAAPPGWSSSALAKSLVVVVLGALTLYLFRRRLF